jgi:hypothetical protein
LETDKEREAHELQVSRTQYDYFMTHREDPARIINVVITGSDQLKLFEMVVTREGQDPKKLEQVSVHRFGFSEHKEMVPILKAQPKDQRTKSWLKLVQQKIIANNDLGQQLGLVPTGQQTPEKRKATDEASDSRPTKK